MQLQLYDLGQGLSSPFGFVGMYTHYLGLENNGIGILVSVFVKSPYHGHCDSKAFKTCVLSKILKRLFHFSTYREK